MKIDPATITSSCTPTVVIDGAAVTVGCAARVTNSSHSQMAIDWQSVATTTSGQPTGSAGNVNHEMLAPGDSVQIAAPPTGQVWSIAFVNAGEVGRAADIAGGLLLAAVFLMGYGAVSLGADVIHKVRSGRHGTPYSTRRGREVRTLR